MSEKITKTPLVTIYIPTYNRVELLKRAVDSVLNQSYKNIELIIVDDCSPDNTIQFLKELAKKDSRIKYFQNNKNSGACVSRNKAIMEAKGEFITGLDDDDYFLPNRIDDFVNTWEKVNCTNRELFVKALYSNPLYKISEYKFKIYKKPKMVTQQDLLYFNAVGNQVFTTTKHLQLIYFDENLPMWQDLDCWFRLIGEGIVINSNKVDYVVDISHEHERITNKKIKKVIRTFSYLKKKYSLNETEAAIFKTHIFEYDLNIINIRRVFKLHLIHYNKKATFILIKKYIKKLIKGYIK